MAKVNFSVRTSLFTSHESVGRHYFLILGIRATVLASCRHKKWNLRPVSRFSDLKSTQPYSNLLFPGSAYWSGNSPSCSHTSLRMLVHAQEYLPWRGQVPPSSLCCLPVNVHPGKHTSCNPAAQKDPSKTDKVKTAAEELIPEVEKSRL